LGVCQAFEEKRIEECCLWKGPNGFQVLDGVRQYTNELQHLCRVTQLLLGVVGIHVHWMADFLSGLESLTLQHQGGSILVCPSHSIAGWEHWFEFNTHGL
jgi:hypothetical protein